MDCRNEERYVRSPVIAYGFVSISRRSLSQGEREIMDRRLHLLRNELQALLPPVSLREHARACDLVGRDCHIDPVPFVGPFLFGSIQPDGSVAGVQDIYKAFTGDVIAYSSIQ